MFMDEQEDEMDRLMKIQENEIDKSMDELFNSFWEVDYAQVDLLNRVTSNNSSSVLV